MSCMALITWFRVCYTRFLPCPLKGANGWLAMAIITLLAMVWLTTLKTQFSHQKPQVQDLKDEHEVLDILFQCSNIFLQCWDVFAFSIFIELFDSSSCDNLTPLPSSIKSLIAIFQSTTLLSSHPLAWLVVFSFCFLSLCYGVPWTYLQWVAKFGL